MARAASRIYGLDMDAAHSKAQVTKKLAGLELPDCFAAATLSSAARAADLGRKADRRDLRRLDGKVQKLLERGAL